MVSKPDHSADYWNSVSRFLNSVEPQRLWRRHSDLVNLAMLGGWLEGTCCKQLLKTDLFDEALSEGLYPGLQKYTQRVLGIDVSTETVTAARQKYAGLNVVLADVRDLPFEDDCVDRVVSNSTLDHFESTSDISAGLEELFRVLRSGGELLISLDNLQNPIVRLRSLLPFDWLNRLGLVPYYVGRSLSRRGLVALLEQTGFCVVDTRAVLHCPRVLAVHLAGLFQRHASARAQARFLAILMKFESMSGWPTRYLSGHFVAARAVKP